MSNLDEMGPGELEDTVDDIYSRLTRAYGRSKADIAKLAVKKYGGEIVTEKTDEVLSKLYSTLNSGKQDITDKMLAMEMIRDLRADRERQPPPQYYPQQPQPQLQQPVQERMSMQDMMVYPMMYMMFKAMMGGGEDDLTRFHRMRMIYGDGDNKNMTMEKMEQFMREERAENEARFEQFMSTIVGRQEAEKIREAREKRDREMEQRIQRAEYLAQHPVQPQEPFQTARDKLDESLGMMTDMKTRMEQAGMVQRPESPEDRVFTKDMEELKHKQNIEAKGVDKLANAADKLSDTVDRTLNKVIDLTAEEQKVRQRQYDMASPEERKELQRQYKVLGEQVLREQPQEEEEATSGDVNFTDEDDLDATD